jgi:hypothetical protein
LESQIGPYPGVRPDLRFQEKPKYAQYAKRAK